jgi:hypothetical protein
MQQITAAMKHASVVDRCKSMPGMPVRKLAITEDSEYSLQLLKIGVAKTKTARVHWLALFQVRGPTQNACNEGWVNVHDLNEKFMPVMTESTLCSVLERSAHPHSVGLCQQCRRGSRPDDTARSVVDAACQVTTVSENWRCSQQDNLVREN